jgi:hypothetical protein
MTVTVEVASAGHVEAAVQECLAAQRGREDAYPKQVAAGKLTMEQASAKIQGMATAVAYLTILASNARQMEHDAERERAEAQRRGGGQP